MSQYGVQCLLKEIFEESGQAEDTAAYNKYLKINFFRHKKIYCLLNIIKGYNCELLHHVENTMEGLSWLRAACQSVVWCRRSHQHS